MKAQDNTPLSASMETASAAIADRCAKDPNWMATFKANPRKELEKAIGRQLPADLQIHLHQNDTEHWHVPVPDLNSKISDSDLRALSGGEVVVVVLGLIGLGAGGAVAGGVVAGGIAGGIIAGDKAADKKKRQGKK